MKSIIFHIEKVIETKTGCLACMHYGHHFSILLGFEEDGTAVDYKLSLLEIIKILFK